MSELESQFESLGAENQQLKAAKNESEQKLNQLQVKSGVYLLGLNLFIA